MATFTASDPEGVTYIGWSLTAVAVNIDGDDGGTNEIDTADIVDRSRFFMIDGNGVLSFATSHPTTRCPRG